MTNKKRFLITVADESTWKLDTAVLFLGHWCLLYERKHIWDELDFSVGSIHGASSEIKNRDLLKSIELTDKLFPELVKILNKFHKTTHSELYWKILVGHSFQTFLNILLNRINTYSAVIKPSSISGAKFYNLNDEDFTPKNTLDLDLNLVNSDIWNSTLDFKLLLFLDEINFPFEIIEKNGVEEFSKSHQKINISKNKLSKQLMFNSIAKHFLRQNNSLILSTYLPKFKEILLHLRFGQIPFFWNVDTYSNAEQVLNKTARDNLVAEIQLKDKLETIILKFIVLYLPKIYIEGFSEMTKIVDKSNWPKNPKFIFTSNEFAYNEQFKFYTAFQREKGAVYFVGQHGNNYGTNKLVSPTIEESTSSKFLTWGWSHGDNFIPTFVLKTAGLKIRHNPKGKIVIMLLHQSARRVLWDAVSEFNVYINDQLNFLDNLKLPPSILLLRAHAASRYNPEGILEKYIIRNELASDNSTFEILEVYKRSRLLIFSYDSTGILESLALNIPTLAFWQNGFDHLNDSAKIQYQKMVAVGIFHLSPESIAKTVNEIWDSVEYWWNQESIQIAREEFCRHYARSSKKPISELHKILKINSQ